MNGTQINITHSSAWAQQIKTGKPKGITTLTEHVKSWETVDFHDKVFSFNS